MQNAVEPGVEQVALDETGAFGEGLPVALREVVEDHHLVALPDEQRRYDAADIARSAMTRSLTSTSPPSRGRLDLHFFPVPKTVRDPDVVSSGRRFSGRRLC